MCLLMSLDYVMTKCQRCFVHYRYVCFGAKHAILIPLRCCVLLVALEQIDEWQVMYSLLLAQRDFVNLAQIQQSPMICIGVTHKRQIFPVVETHFSYPVKQVLPRASGSELYSHQSQ